MGRRLITDALRGWHSPSWTPSSLDPYGVFAAMHAVDDETATVVALERPGATETTPERATA